MEKKRVKGTYDLVPGADGWKDPVHWNYLESLLREVSQLYGFEEIRTPIFEHTEIFTRAVGADTDIGSKEMYTFEDRGGRSLSLKPEGTAPAIRAFNENSLHQTAFDRFFYIGQYFRYDRPQKGRFRQFQQFGCEVVGKKDPYIDAEIIAMAAHIYEKLGIESLTLLINSIGTPLTRKTYTEKLQAFLQPKITELSDESQRRVSANPLRILDSKDAKDHAALEGAPTILTELDKETRAYFDKVCDYLTQFGISYTIETTLVRGLDYYTDTVFEFVATDDSAAQNTLCAGGRYDGLTKALGGPDLPGFGFALGCERTLDYLIAKNLLQEALSRITAYVIPLSDSALKAASTHTQSLRKRGISARCHDRNFNLKKGLQTATKLGATYVVIIGEDELKNNKAKVKHLLTREEEEVPLASLYQYNW